MSAPDTISRDEGLRRRILGLIEETVVAIADEVRRLDAGWVARTPSLPQVHTLNQLHASAPVDPAMLLALADEHQRGQGFRHLTVDDPGTAAGLAELLGDARWKTERLVLMALAGRPPRPADPAQVTELDVAEMDRLMRRWAIEDHLDSDEGVLDQLAEYNRREGELWHERRLGIRGDDGRAVAITKLRLDGPVAWVEDVYTVPEARGRGHARTLVTIAVERALATRPDLTFIVADDEDWPQHLYADIGFRPVGRIWTFHGPGDGR